jgi:hypothetical protein
MGLQIWKKDHAHWAVDNIPPPTTALGNASLQYSPPLSSPPPPFSCCFFRGAFFGGWGVDNTPLPTAALGDAFTAISTLLLSPTPLLLLLLSLEVLYLVVHSFLLWQDELLLLLRVAHVISMNENWTLKGVLWWLLKFGNAC